MISFFALCSVLILARACTTPTQVGIEANPSVLMPYSGTPNVKTCTANEVQVQTSQNPIILNGDNCNDGYIDLKFRINLQSNTNRYNFGLFVSNDGKCAGGNNCVGAARTSNYSGVVSFVCDGENVPFTGLAPAGDTCGDMISAAPVNWWVVGTFACVFDGIGNLVIPNCLVWDQNEPKASSPCTSLALAGTGSKCQCDPIKFPACQFIDIPNSCGVSDECTERGCSATTGKCFSTPRANGTPCGNQSNADCDAPNVCESGTCVEKVKPNTFECRGTNGNECDVAEFCTGSSATCPLDGSKPDDTACGSQSNADCDAPNVCESGTCVEKFKPNTAQCRPGNGICDPPEFCPGDGASCPPDATILCSNCCTRTQGYWKTHSASWSTGTLRKLRSPVPSETWNVLAEKELTHFYNCKLIDGETNITWFWILTSKPNTVEYKTLIQAGRHYIAAYLSIAECGGPADGSTLPDTIITSVGEVNYSVRGCYQSVQSALETCSLPFALSGYDVNVCAGILDSFVNGALGWPHCGDSDDPNDPGYCYRTCNQEL